MNGNPNKLVTDKCKEYAKHEVRTRLTEKWKDCAKRQVQVIAKSFDEIVRRISHSAEYFICQGKLPDCNLDC